MSNYSERVSNILAENQLTIVDFCNKLGLNSQTTISKIVSQNRKPSSKTFGRILKAFPEISYQWLIKGEGEMYKSQKRAVSGTLPDSMSNNDDLTVTAKQVINQLDINNKHYTAILDQKMKDDRDYYDNESNHVKNIASILEGFKSLEEKVEKYAVQASTEVVNNIIRVSNNTETKFNALAQEMDVNAVRRSTEVTCMIVEKMDESNQYWIKRAEKKDAYWLKENNQQKDLFLKALDKVLSIEQDLEDIKTFMAANFELDKMNKKKSKQIKKLVKK